MNGHMGDEFHLVLTMTDVVYHMVVPIEFLLSIVEDFLGRKFVHVRMGDELPIVPIVEDVCVRKFVHVRMAGELTIVLIAGDVCVRKCVHVRMVVGLALRFLFVLHMVNLKKVKKSLIN